MHAPRRRGQGSSVLYWFRTPPGVRIGRAPLDDEAKRLIQEHHPEIGFDWPRILSRETREEDTGSSASRTRGAREGGRPSEPPLGAAPTTDGEAVAQARAREAERPARRRRRKRRGGGSAPLGAVESGPDAESNVLLENGTGSDEAGGGIGPPTSDPGGDPSGAH